MKIQKTLWFTLMTLLIGVFDSGACARNSFIVDAQLNSVSGGAGLNTGLVIAKGQLLAIDARTEDKWTINPDNAYLCNANGEGNPFGTSLASSFTLPGTDFTFLYGTLVGSLDDGKTFFPIGTHSEQMIVIESGTLSLYMWDRDSANNSGKINVDIDVYNTNQPTVN
jgi:hypothetical protein